MQLKEGDKVHYSPNNGPKENGVVKSVSDGNVFVVYHCAGEWDKYMNYTGQNTPKKNIRKGWVDEKGNLMPEYCDHHYIHTNAKWRSPNQMECCYCYHVIN